MKCEIKNLKPTLAHDVLQRKINNMGVASLPAEQVRNRAPNDWSIDLSVPVDWKCEKINSRPSAFKLNGFVFLDGLYREYVERQDAADAAIIKEYMLDFIEHVPPYEEAMKYGFWPYHDDATAVRMLRWCIFYPGIRRFLSVEEAGLIEKSMAEQAVLLMEDDFYTKLHNHGMHMDMALLAYALTLAPDEISRRYISKALERILEYIEYVYTKDGIHKEHSPSYALLAVQDIIFVCDLIREAVPEVHDVLLQYKENAYSVLRHLMKPNGKMPPLGDSLEKDGKASLLRLFGKCDEHPADVVYEPAGYAIFRTHEEDGWLLLNCATFSSTHKHGDDLEVLLYHKGDLFVEGGQRDYNYKSKETAWTYSGYAHNVLLVDEQPYPVKISKNGKQNPYPEAMQTRITEYQLEESVSEATGICMRHKGLVQQRKVRLDKDKREAMIEDLIKSNKVCRGTLLWHIAPGVSIEEIQGGFAFSRKETRIAEAVFTASRAFKLTCLKQRSFPFFSGSFNGTTMYSGALLRMDFPIIAGDNRATMHIKLL